MGISDRQLPPERSIIGKAPVSWALAVITATAFVSGGIYLIMESRYSGQAEGLRQQVQTLLTQLAGKDSRIAELEKKIAADAEMVARALSFYQQSLAQKVQELPTAPNDSPASVDIIGSEDNPLLQKLSTALEDSGWTVGRVLTPTDAGASAMKAALAETQATLSGVYLFAPDTINGKALRDALQTAGIPYAEWHDGPTVDAPTLVIRSWDDPTSWTEFLKLSP